jgi:hypothetical protein
MDQGGYLIYATERNFEVCLIGQRRQVEYAIRVSANRHCRREGIANGVLCNQHPWQEPSDD